MTRHIAVFATRHRLAPMLAGALAFLSPRIVYDGAREGGGAVTGDDLKRLETSITQMGAKMQTGSDEMKKAAELFQTETKNLGKATEETKQLVDKAMTEGNKNAEALKVLQADFARLAAGDLGNPAAQLSAGEQFVQGEAYKEASDKYQKDGERPRSFRMATTVTSATTDAAGSAGAAVRPDRIAGILTPALRRLTIRDLLMPGTTGSNLVEYVREKGWTNGAASQNGEGTTKGQSDIQMELKNSPVITIAHWMLASKQILADAPQLKTLIDTRLRYGLKLKEEDQLLNGTGAASTLSGLIQNSTPYVDQNVTVAAEQYVDVLRQAMLQAFVAEWPATGHILNPNDWARIELLKDGENRYLWADPRSLAAPSMWGLPIVQTQAMRETKFMTGAFVPAAQIFDREGISVEVSTEDSDNFRKNLVTVLCEERLTLIVYRTEALIYGDFGEWS